MVLMIIAARTISLSQAVGTESAEERFCRSANQLRYKILHLQGPAWQRQAELDSLKNLPISRQPEYAKILTIQFQAAIDSLRKIEERTTYRVRPGDNLWDIAEEKAQNPFRWRDILEENKDKVKKPELLPIDLNLRLRTLLDSLGISALLPHVDSLKVLAPSLAATPAPSTDDIEIEGLVVDETQTKIGHDFYDFFYASWEVPEELKGYTVVVSERTMPRLGTQVSIRVNETEVFQSFIQPRADAIEETANYAVALTLDYLRNYQEIQADLQGQDLKGSGIY